MGQVHLGWEIENSPEELILFFDNFLENFLKHSCPACHDDLYLQKMAKCGVKCVLDLGEYISGGGIIHRAVRVVHKHKIPRWGSTMFVLRIENENLLLTLECLGRNIAGRHSDQCARVALSVA